MKIVFYGARNTGMVVLTYLVAKCHDVVCIPEDQNLLDLCEALEVPVVTLDTMGDYDLFVCCHGKKIIPGRYLKKGRCINIHPCLFKYKGHNPIKRYIENCDTLGSVESLYMTDAVDDGEVIQRFEFDTPVCNSYAEFYNIALPYYFWCIDTTLRSIDA
jgi:methionyl-tRNA formyltransferase